MALILLLLQPQTASIICQQLSSLHLHTCSGDLQPVISELDEQLPIVPEVPW